MKIVARSIALAVAFSLAFSGPLATFATAQQPSQSETTQEPPKPSSEDHSAAYGIGAGFANVFYVPGKVILCGLGVIVGTGFLLLTFGTAYKAAAAIGEEGCGGKWVVTGEDLMPTKVVGESEKLVTY